jgi:hypothetical protein
VFKNRTRASDLTITKTTGHFCGADRCPKLTRRRCAGLAIWAAKDRLREKNGAAEGIRTPAPIMTNCFADYYQDVEPLLMLFLLLSQRVGETAF